LSLIFARQSSKGEKGGKKRGGKKRREKEGIDHHPFFAQHHSWPYLSITKNKEKKRGRGGKKNRERPNSLYLPPCPKLRALESGPSKKSKKRKKKKGEKRGKKKKDGKEGKKRHITGFVHFLFPLEVLYPGLAEG